MSRADAEIVDTVLAQWRSAVDAHQPDRVATCFTDDAIFQGLHPYSVGPAGVAAYYDSQPMGMTAAYRIEQTRRLADDVVFGFLAVEFAFADRPPLQVSLGVILRRTGDRWLIAHYQVTRL